MNYFPPCFIHRLPYCSYGWDEIWEVFGGRNTDFPRDSTDTWEIAQNMWD
jgi:hypothetical protein